MRRVLAFALFLAACRTTAEAPPPVRPAPTATASQEPAPPPPAASLESKESKAVARTLKRVSELRGVSASRPVPGLKLERDELVGKIKDKALREYPADALRREGQLLQLFGFAPTSFDYLGEMMKLLSAQLEGFYEPNNGTMYLAADLRGKEAQATLAHELVHALQDQNWDLKSRSTYRPGKGDETLALACLAEGDATSLMMDFVMADQQKSALDLPEPMLRELMTNGMNGESVKSVPHVLRSSLIAPYIDGLAFVHQLRKRGGWAMVDRAWKAPPISTEQILHVEKWEKHEPPIAVAAPTAQALGPGYTLADEDTFGELALALTFEEWADGPVARDAALGWGGDRSAIFANKDTIAFAIKIRFDAEPKNRAKNAIAKLAPAMKKKIGRPTVDGAEAICFERADLGPLLLTRRGDDVAIIAGPTSAAGTAWKSAGTCALAKTWAAELLP
jgi:hypothetical protein